jgi:hypothetical protein
MTRRGKKGLDSHRKRNRATQKYRHISNRRKKSKPKKNKEEKKRKCILTKEMDMLDN